MAGETIELTQEQELEALMGGQAQAADDFSEDVTPEPPVEGRPADEGAAPLGTKGAEADAKLKEAVAEQESPIEDLLAKRSGFGESDEQKRGRIEREYKASTKEAQRLNEAFKATRELLKEQGLDLHLDGETARIVQAKDARKSDRQVVKIDFNSLSQDEKDLFDVDQQKAVELIQERTAQTLLNVKATSAPPVPKLSDERREAAVEFVKSEQEADESPKNPNFEKNLHLIEKWYLGAPNAPESLKALYNQEPELALSLLNHKLNSDRAFLESQAAKQTEKQKQKASDSEQSPELGPAGGGVPATGEKSLSDQWGEAIANATPVF